MEEVLSSSGEWSDPHLSKHRYLNETFRLFTNSPHSSLERIMFNNANQLLNSASNGNNTTIVQTTNASTGNGSVGLLSGTSPKRVNSSPTPLASVSIHNTSTNDDTTTSNVADNTFPAVPTPLMLSNIVTTLTTIAGNNNNNNVSSATTNATTDNSTTEATTDNSTTEATSRKRQFSLSDTNHSMVDMPRLRQQPDDVRFTLSSASICVSETTGIQLPLNARRTSADSPALTFGATRFTFDKRSFVLDTTCSTRSSSSPTPTATATGDNQQETTTSTAGADTESAAVRATSNTSTASSSSSVLTPSTSNSSASTYHAYHHHRIQHSHEPHHHASHHSSVDGSNHTANTLLRPPMMSATTQNNTISTSASSASSEAMPKRRRISRQYAFQMETATLAAVSAQGPKELEDRLKLVESLEVVSPELNHISFIGVFDGHNGSGASEFAQHNLWWELAVNSNFKQTRYETALREAFVSTDQKFLHLARRGIDSSGSCALVMVVVGNRNRHSDTDPYRIYVANAGDSRAILCRSDNSAPLVLSNDHNLSNSIERNRVLSTGALVHNNKLFGMLRVSRAIGDRDFKPNSSDESNRTNSGASARNRRSNSMPSDATTNTVVSSMAAGDRLQSVLLAEPEIVEHTVGPNDEFVIVATDGVWDVLSNDEVQTIARRQLQLRRTNDSHGLQKCAEAVAEEAVQRGSRDDISVVVRLL